MDKHCVVVRTGKTKPYWREVSSGTVEMLSLVKQLGSSATSRKYSLLWFQLRDLKVNTVCEPLRGKNWRKRWFLTQKPLYTQVYPSV